MIVFWILIILLTAAFAVVFCLAVGDKVYDTSNKIKKQFIDDEKEDDQYGL